MTEQEIQEKEKELEQREARISAKEKVTQKAYERAKEDYQELQKQKQEYQEKLRECEARTKALQQIKLPNQWKLHPWYQGAHTLTEIVKRMRQDGLTQMVIYSPFRHTVFYLRLNEVDTWYVGWWHIKQTNFHCPTFVEARQAFQDNEWSHSYFCINPEIAELLHASECQEPIQIAQRFLLVANHIGGDLHLKN